MSNRFSIDKALLALVHERLSCRHSLLWIVGGAGSGKTTVCRALSARLGIPTYDMDAHIYGEYHQRFSPARHPVNAAWSTADNGLAWLLNMSWDEFNGFNQAALPEYLDLFAEDIHGLGFDDGLLIDGGISNPGLLAQAIPSRQIVCLSAPHQSSSQIWEESGARKAMQEAIYQLPNPEAAWHKFLEFDQRLTHIILSECRQANISIHQRNAATTVEAFAEQVVGVLGVW
jgi:hypothetical protein